jgi:hypothetical protein
MTDNLFTITQDQRDILDANPHYHAVSFLDDGDLLIAEDAGSLPKGDRTYAPNLWATWLLDRYGQVSTVERHYGTHHDWENETPGRPAPEPPPPQTTPAPKIIDVQEAAQHLLLQYRVAVTPRTVRNWLKDGKLAGSQLGTADRSPWYTTRDAIDVAATRAWFPDPLPELVDQDQAEHLAAMAELEADARLGHLLADVDQEAPNELDR